MKTITVRLSDEQAVALRELSEATRVPQVTYLRDALGLILSRARSVGALLDSDPEILSLLRDTKPCCCSANAAPHHHLDRYKA